jgi:zinc transport system ATP-binding protein
MEILKVSNLGFKYPGQIEMTLRNINFSLRNGEALGVMGPNGGGKTTLMKILSGVLKSSEGELIFFNQDVTDLKNFPREQISYIPQTSGINLSLPLSAYEYLFYAGKALGIKELDAKINTYAKQVGISEKLNYFFKDMSGGEKQRVLIAKALLNNPRLIILDEPTKGLDSLGQDQLLFILKKIREENQTAVIIVDHNINQVIRFCDKIICLNKTSHWHDNKELLTKNILENIYHCELEHLLIHEKELSHNTEHAHDHQFCSHEHQHENHDKKHQFIRRKN